MIICTNIYSEKNTDIQRKREINVRKFKFFWFCFCFFFTDNNKAGQSRHLGTNREEKFWKSELSVS